jgi:uncharacterized protein (TIGR03435 family)
MEMSDNQDSITLRLHMRVLSLRIGMAIVVAGSAFSQTADKGPRFEVASVKASATGQIGAVGPESIVARPGSLAMKRVRLRACIKWAYDLKEYQISGPNWMGSPGWLGSDVARYDIQAKAAEGTPVPELKLMLQTLLAERFSLLVHSEKREVSAYSLTVQKQGPDLHQVGDVDGESTPVEKNGVLVLRKITIPEFAEFIAGPIGAPVVDATNLKGRFDLSINEAPYMPATGATREDSQYAFVKAIQEQLGLKLERRPHMIEFLVVDHAEKAPTEN